MKSNSPYFPTQINQNSINSIVTDKGLYDFKRFSYEEEYVIYTVLDTVKTNFTPQYYSIGLALESFGIVYKPRYILYELIVLKYRLSSEPIDQLAVGLAYSNKGAFYRKFAIEYIEKSIKKVPSDCLELISIIYPLWGIYGLLSELCEKELMFEKAMNYALLSAKNKQELTLYDYLRPGQIYLKINIDSCVYYYNLILEQPISEEYKKAIRSILNEVQIKQQKGYKYKPRRRNQQNSLDEDIKAATIKYLHLI